MIDDLSMASAAIAFACATIAVVAVFAVCRISSCASRPSQHTISTSDEQCSKCKPKNTIAAETVAIQSAGVRDYPAWNNFAGTYFAFNPPWMLELQRRNSSERDDRRRYRQYLATHVRRYLELPRVETAHYVFTAGSLKRHPQQLDRFTQFLRDLKDFSGLRWREIGSRISMLEVPEGDEAKYAATVFSGLNYENDEPEHKTIAYLDIDSFCTSSGIPARTVVIRGQETFRSLESLYDRMVAHPSSRRWTAEEWLEKVWPQRGGSPPLSRTWPQTFISYSHHDEQVCLDVKRVLEREGFNPWSDHDIGNGHYWRSTLSDTLKGVNCCVLLHSVNSAKEESGVREEIDFLKPRLTTNDAGCLRARILVLRLDLTDLPHIIADIQSKISLVNWKFEQSDLISHIPQDKRTAEIARSVESFLDDKELL